MTVSDNLMSELSESVDATLAVPGLEAIAIDRHGHIVHTR